MKFEYNGNLEEERRIKQVANEIKFTYPEIDMKKAKLIASLEDPITTQKTHVMEFKRLYNILFVMQDYEYIFKDVYEDIKKVYLKINNKNELIEIMMIELSKFARRLRLEFPIISEFM